MEGLTPPVFIDLDGNEHKGKLVSVVQGLQLQDKLNQALADGLPADKLDEVFKEILGAMGLPADKILALPSAAFWDAMDSFFSSHRRKAPTPAGTATTETAPVPASPAAPSA